MKVLYLKYGLTALMMAFAVVMLYSCSNGNKKTVEENKNLKQDDRGIINGHEYVKIAGIKWATENVGEVDSVEAIATDETYGYYYTQENAVKAVASWGGKWKLPTEEQWQKLKHECYWVFKDCCYGGKTMTGYVVTDKKDSSRFILLPSAGCYYIDGNFVYNQSGLGYYWSAEGGRYLETSYVYRTMSDDDTINGLSVRPVLME